MIIPIVPIYTDTLINIMYNLINDITNSVGLTT